MSMDGPVVLGVERVNNPHILPIFDELRLQPGIRFTGCVLEPLKPWRVEIGWPELAEDAPYLQPFRRARDQARYLELAESADIVIWPGIKFANSIRLITNRSRRGKLNVIWAESFTHKHRHRWYQRLAFRAVIKLLNSRRVHLMTMGAGAETDYRNYGASKWTCWQFGYAVSPIPNLQHDLHSATDNDLRILFVGALRNIKGVDVLLRALADRSRVRDTWKLKLVGQGVRRDALTELAANLGIASKVEFAGAVPRDQIHDVYANADVLVLPSRFDGWGAVINEAMEHGLAVIASDAVGCARVLIEPGVNGFVFPSEDHETLAEYIGRLTSDTNLCASMRKASRRRIREFRPLAAAERSAKLFRGLTGYEPLPHFTEGYCAALP